MNTKINVAALSTLFHSDVNAGSKPEPQAKEAVDDARAFVRTHARRHVTLSLLTQLQLSPSLSPPLPPPPHPADSDSVRETGQ